MRDQRCCNVHPASFNQLARYSRGSFARNSSRQKTPTTESPPSVKQSRTISNPERCSFVAFEPPKVSLPVDLHFLPYASNAPSLVSRLTLRLSMSVDNRTSNQTSALKRKKMFLARVEWLPVTSRSHGQTDKCKISIMIIYIYTRSELASLAPSFRGHNFCSKHTSNNLRLRTRTYAHAHIHSSPQATPPIDIEGCGLRDQR